MTIRGKLFRTSQVLLLLAAAVAPGGLWSTASASDQAAQNYLRSLAKASDGPDITATVNARAGLPGGAPLTLAASHARAARALFHEARVTMERGFLLGEATPRTNVAVLEAAMKELGAHLAIVAATTKPQSDTIKQASSLAQNWYEAGLKIIRPPAEGITELPSPVSVQSKADAASMALDLVIKETIAAAPRPARAAKRRAQPESRVVADGVNPLGIFIHNQNTHH